MKRLLVILGLTAFAALLLTSPAQAQSLSESVLALDGVNDYAIGTDAPFDLGTGASDAFTLETWLCVPTLTGEERIADLFSKQGSYTVDLFFHRVVDPDEPPQDGVAVTVDYASGSSYTLTIYHPLADANWHHLAVVFDDELRIYIDGWKAQGVMGTSPLTDTPSAFSVCGSPSSDCFPGWLEETRVSSNARYSGSLSYLVPSTPFVADAQTVALWHFDEAAGATTFSDASSRGNDLTGAGGAAVTAAPEAPVTTATLVPQPNAAGWNKGLVRVLLSAAGMECWTYFATPDADYPGLAWIWYNPYLPPDPEIYINDNGSASVWYYSTLGAPAISEFPKRLTVRVDGTKPVTMAVADSTVNRSHRAVLKLRVNDTVSPKAKVTVKIIRRGVCKKTLKLGLRTTNVAIRYSEYTCWLPRGTYVWKVYAADLAGNTQRLPVGSKTLVVR